MKTTIHATTGARVARPRRTQSSGFTLVEILVVIIIISLLAALVSSAVLGAIKRAREARVQLEMNQLDLAIKSMSDRYGAIPPGESTLRSAEFEPQDSRNNRLVSFISRAFPQFVPDPTFNSTYEQIRLEIGYGTLFNPDFNQPLGSAPNVYNFPASGYVGRNCCDINTLDAAETLVFWLGGLPRQYLGTDNKVLIQLTGFSSAAVAPFRYPTTPQDIAGGSVDSSWISLGGVQRSKPLFDFANSRLTDYDQDGWPEYIPDLPATGSTTPPYVYFEVDSYSFRPIYPGGGGVLNGSDTPAIDGVNPTTDDTTTSVDERQLISKWGTAKAYAAAAATEDNGGTVLPPTQWTVNWAQTSSFQIICAGSDGIYGGAPQNVIPGDIDPENPLAVRVFKLGERREPTQTDNQPLHEGENDNLSNFTTGKLEDSFQRN